METSTETENYSKVCKSIYACDTFLKIPAHILNMNLTMTNYPLDYIQHILVESLERM